MATCASTDSLAQLLDGTLAETEASALRAHLGGCRDCQAAIEQLSDHTVLRQWKSACSGLSPYPSQTSDVCRLLDDLRAAAPAQTPPTTVESKGPPTVHMRQDVPGELGPYRVLGELGRGGMGIVWKAYDPALERVVAVKVLHEYRTDYHSRERFVREARAAAALKHDHIVAVHAVANPPRGSPYLVMEYIEGPTLYARIKAEGRLDPREAARICCQVGDGLVAAHRAGLIHRDIKPANILLDSAIGHRPSAVGQTAQVEGCEPQADPIDRQVLADSRKPTADSRAKITDFGLVRATERTNPQTQEGMIAGTPEYMSPEQINTPESIDARSDVYNLGATLYEALTGSVPFRGVATMILEQILRDEPVPPRRLSDQIPRDLETICLKAMAKEPTRRYQTAAELRDDLQHWLDGEPIHARPVGRVERTWRWCKRKPALAGAIAALLVVFMVGFSGVTWQWLRADRNHDAAEERRQKAHAAIHDYFTLVSENKLLGKPGLQELRKDLLDTALRYYQDFLAEWGDDPKMQAEVAATHVRVAAMQAQLGQPGAARNSYQQALVLYEKMARARSGDTELLAAQAKAYSQMGELLSSTGSLGEALGALQRARSLQAERVDADQANLDQRAALAKVDLEIAVLMEKRDQRAEARRAFTQVRDAWQQLVDADPRADFCNELASTWIAMSNLPYTDGAWDEALLFLGNARDLLRRLTQEHPAVAEYQASLAMTLTKLSNVHHQLGRLDDAVAASREARDLRERLVHDNPAVTEFQFRLALAYAYHGKDLGQRPSGLREALANCDLAFPLLEKLLRIVPGHPPYRQRLADLWLDRGHYLSKLDQPAEALPCFVKGRAILEELLAEHPDHPDLHQILGAACHNHGNELQQVGRRQEARQAFERSQELFGIMLAKDPQAVFTQEMLVRLPIKLAGLCAAEKEHDQEGRHARQALERARRLHRAHPQSPSLERLLAQCCMVRGLAARNAGKLAEAETSFQEALAIREKFAKVQPPITDACYEAAVAYRDLADLRRKDRPAEALPLYELCRQRCEEALNASPDLRARSVLGQAWDGVAACQAQLGKHTEGLQAYARAGEIHKAVLEQSPNQTVYRERFGEHCQQLAGWQRALGQPAEAAATIRAQLKLWPKDPDALYRAARELGLCLSLVGKDKSSLTVSEEEDRSRYADEVLTLLQEAIRNGFTDLARLRSDSAFEPLRQRQDFRSLSIPLEKPATRPPS